MTFNLEAQRGHLGVFLAFQLLGGQIGMFLILLTLLIHRRTTRHAVFVNFCITWIIYSGSYVLLLYAGEIENPNPSFALCVTQAGMIYGSPAMIGASTFIFILHLFLVLRRCVHAMPPPKWQKLRLATMLVVPYVVFLAVFTTAIIVGTAHPEQVHRSNFYCSIELRSVFGLAGGFSTIAAIAAIVVEVLTGITLHRHWRVFRAAEKTGLNLSIFIRALVFTVCSIIALAASVAFLVELNSFAPTLALAILPMAAFLVFGTQTDLLRPWCFWRKTFDGPSSGGTPKNYEQFDSASSTPRGVGNIRGGDV